METAKPKDGFLPDGKTEAPPVALTDRQRKTIWSWCKYLGKVLSKAVLQRLSGEVSL